MSAACLVVRSPICFDLVNSFTLKLQQKHPDSMIVNSELNLPEEMSSLFCCSVSTICFDLVNSFTLKLQQKHPDSMIVNSELNLPEEMSSLFCCSVSTSSFASLILSFIRSAVSLDLRAISDLAAVLLIMMVIFFSHSTFSNVMAKLCSSN